MVADPYKALGVGHDASTGEIKRAYRKACLIYHPDRLIPARASPEEISEATNKFAAISSAYAILSDDSRKRQYDHIYKYGGYDEPEASPPRNRRTYSSGPATKRHNSGGLSQKDKYGHEQQKQQQKGIGYAIYDPFTYVLSQGKIQSKTVAGISIPSRLNMAHPGNRGLRLCFSNGQIRKTASGSMEFTSKTTQFAGGKKMSRFEKTTLRKDGRKEVIIEGDDYIERRVSTAPKRKRAHSKDEDDLTRTGSPDDDIPWYVNAWNGVRDSVQMCTTGHCGPISVR
mmetsp:Transcript_1638/g.2510  ORF Transcript_1638/g.2510 Transcript_1638/m.2510 type:complete len:284 (+) Transcript_1638:176-1027(+)